MSTSKTLPATTRRGVQVVKSPRKIPAAVVCGGRREKRAGLLSAYRLPVFVQRPPFSLQPYQAAFFSSDKPLRLFARR